MSRLHFFERGTFLGVTAELRLLTLLVKTHSVIQEPSGDVMPRYIRKYLSRPLPIKEMGNIEEG
jgi:hypothetical protein